MLKPKLLGSLILLYVILYKLWEFAVVVMSSRPGGRLVPETSQVVLGYTLVTLFGLVLLSYTTGSVGLFLRRRWSAVVVFYTAIVEATILLCASVLFLYMVIGGSVGGIPPISVLPLLLLMVFPVGFAYAARSLRKNPELWQPPKKELIDMAESADRIQADVIRPAWLQKIFWTVIGTGLLLPVIMALFVMTVALVQGEPFDLSGDALFVLILGTVLFALPYIVLAFIVRAVLRRASKEGGHKPVQRLFLLAGIFFGMTAFIIPNLYTYFGSAEAVATLMFAPFVPFMAALPGVVAGAIVGLIAYFVWKITRRSDGVSEGREPISPVHGSRRWMIGLTMAVTAVVVSVILIIMISLGRKESSLELKDGSKDPEMVRIEGGRFWMGSDRSVDSAAVSNEQPRHEVSIGPFYIGKYEVTFEEYNAFVRSTGAREPDDKGYRRGRRPVVDVSWEDAIAYAEWLSEQTGMRYRLPTEAEWEYAARGGTETLYWWGNDVQQDGKVWANCNGCGTNEWSRRPAPVGSFQPNAFGVHDTAGNVWEWVQDCWHWSYEGAPDDGSVWEASEGVDCNKRVFRGGSWHGTPRELRSAHRARNRPGTSALVLGFRLARDVE
ncbi:MAG: SUMF1/EgtB/PvdO family nonheme iron enzyme [Gammaproteobacteria bacterium]